MECRGDQEPNLFIHDRNMMILRMAVTLLPLDKSDYRLLNGCMTHLSTNPQRRNSLVGKTLIVSSIYRDIVGKER